MSDVKWHELNMTSNNTPAPYVVSASSEFNSTMSIWQAFNNLKIEPVFGWMSTNVNTSEWIKVDFGVIKKLNKLSITARTNSPSSTITNFTLMGSNDGVTYVNIKTFSLGSWIADETKIIDFPTVKYRYIKFDIKKESATSYLSVAEIMFGLVEIRAVIKNPSTSHHYSLAEKTLISLPDASDKNMILHGIEAGKEIQLDEAFDKIQYINELSTATQGISGKIVTQELLEKPNKILKLNEVR